MMTNHQKQTKWQHLEKRPDSWRKQLYIKGRKLTAFGLWNDMMVNADTPEETAHNWDLPLEAVIEAIKYCEIHKELITNEADAERSYLEERGISLDPTVVH